MNVFGQHGLLSIGYNVDLELTLAFLLGPVPWSLSTPDRIPTKTDKVNKGANIRNRYNQVPHLTQDTNGKVTNSHLDTKNESQEVSPFQAGDHKAHINRRAQRHNKHKTEKKPIKDPLKKYYQLLSKLLHGLQ